MMRAAIFAIDTGAYKAKAESAAATALKRLLEQAGFEVKAAGILPQEREVVAAVENLAGASPCLRVRSIIRSLLSAHFNNMYGRWSIWAVMNFSFSSIHSFSIMPQTTSHPASRSILIPLPLTSLNGSALPVTMRGIFLRIINSLHGGVFP